MPTDDEWVFTARGGLTVSMNSDEDYPWQGPFDPRRATTKESADGQTVPVNKHPMGCTKDGVWDMSGNAYEWLAAMNDESVGYLKGGSWWSDRMQASISAIGKASRWLRHNYYGLRIVVVNNQLQPKYKRRDAVVHQEFGIGTVIKSEITYNDEEVTVAFPGTGIKKVAVYV